MTWYIERGDDMLLDQTKRFPFYRRLSEGFTSSELIFRDSLVQSESVIPPVYPNYLTTKTNCSLTADLREVDRSMFNQIIGVDDRTYFDVHFDLAITMKSAVMKFWLEMDGKEMGTVDAKYE